jgi:predicted nucleic acid-binding protein
MKVIVDTSIWSTALRRDSQTNSETVLEFQHLIHDHRVQMIGPVRQEILSGIRHESQFNKLKSYLENFPDLPIITEDYATAAKFFNLCRTKGVQGSNTDFLICAVAVRNKLAIYSTDKDFDLFSKHIPITMYRPGKPQLVHNA